jgi:hypothetical protein
MAVYEIPVAFAVGIESVYAGRRDGLLLLAFGLSD